MKCKNCGHEAVIDESEPYASYYLHGSVFGTPDCKQLESHCSKCGYEFADSMKYCPICGIKRKKCSCKACTEVIKEV